MSITNLLGKTLTKVKRIKDEEIQFHEEDGTIWRMLHIQDCCEKVYIEDVVGDLQDLVGSPILVASEEENQEVDEHDGSSTWTFYKIDTVKGGVTIRWCGFSNGYYSESVDFFKKGSQYDY